MIVLFASGATLYLVAKNGTKKSSQLFEELQGSNLELKLSNPNLLLELILKCSE